MRDTAVNASLARFITRVCVNAESGWFVYLEAKEILGNDFCDGHVIGITGSAAAGKSTLIDRIITELRKHQHTVVVLTIDPTERESGGSILADGMRMRDHYLDTGVFIRSFAGRGASGATAPEIRSAINLARPFADFVIVETAGAGQGDVALAEMVNTFIALPDSRGDDVTLLKSGAHRHAHILAVNERRNSLEDKQFFALLSGIQPTFPVRAGWETKIFIVDALKGVGIEKLVREGIFAHRDFLQKKET